MLELGSQRTCSSISPRLAISIDVDLLEWDVVAFERGLEEELGPIWARINDLSTTPEDEWMARAK